MDVADLDASSGGPGLENPTDVLCVITAYFLGGAAPFDNVFQDTDYPLRRQVKVDFDAEPSRLKLSMTFRRRMLRPF